MSNILRLKRSEIYVFRFLPTPVQPLSLQVCHNSEQVVFRSFDLPIGKGKGLDTCYSATYMSRDQQRFTISEVAADWHEPMVPQRIMWPFIAALTDNWTHGAASRRTIGPISHARPLPRSYYSFPVPLRVGG